MSKKVVLITGASRGIGKAAAEKLLKNGYIVYGAARTEESLKYLSEWDNGNYKLLDITKAEMRKKCVEEIIKTEGKIDILINNAGYGSLGAIEDIELEEAKRQFEVNLFGLAAMIKLILPEMRKRNSGKIINISSTAGKTWTPFGGWYNASKFALEGLSDCLRNEVKEFGVEVILVEPGAINSNWADVASENLLKTSGKGPYSTKAKRTVKAFEKIYSKKGLAAEVDVVADTILKAVKSKNAKSRYIVPIHAKLMIFFHWLLPDKIYDFFVNKILA